MDYYSKIEAYLEDNLNAIEKMAFEHELAENTALNEAFEAYNMADSLFDFSANELSEETVLENTAIATTEQLIYFAATNLEEEAIIPEAKPASSESNSTILRFIPLKAKRTWLVAASMTLLLSAFGIQYWKQEARVAPSKMIAANTVAQDLTKLPTNIPTVTPVTIAKPNFLQNIKAPSKKYPKARKKVIKKTIQKNIIQPINDNANPIAMNTAATEIATEALVKTGQALTLTAENTVTLKAGFYAEAGADFSVNSAKSNLPKKDIKTAAIISEKESITYKAENSITLTAGFHAQAGSGFTAAIKQ